MAAFNRRCSSSARLQRDLRELQREPLGFASAVPLEGNLHKWHVNLSPRDGPYQGIIFHATMEFPWSYPNDPPDVSLCTLIRHPNVYGSWICLDMLREKWSPAYTVAQILIQLYGFLVSDVTIGQEHGGDQQRSVKGCDVIACRLSAESFRCQECGHTCHAPHPSVTRAQGATVQRPTSASGSSVATTFAHQQQEDLDILLHTHHLSKSARRRRNRRAHVDTSGASAEAPATATGPATAPAAPATASTTAALGPTAPTHDVVMERDAMVGQQAAAVAVAPSPSSAIPSCSQLLVLDDHVLRTILSRLRAEDLLRVEKVNRSLALLATDVRLRSELCCYASKLPHSAALLGIGVLRVWHASGSSGSAGGFGYSNSNSRPFVPPASRPSPPQDFHAARRASERNAAAVASSEVAALKELRSGFEPLALEAFQAGITRPAWADQEHYDAWLPLYLNKQHGQGALAVLPAAVAALLSRTAPTFCIEGPQVADVTAAAAAAAMQKAGVAKSRSFPSDALQLLGKLTNCLVVRMVSTQDTSRSLCNASLGAFCHMHHLLLALATSEQHGKAVRAAATHSVLAFVRGGPQARRKDVCPDLGVLLVAYALVPQQTLPWEEFAPVLLRELLARQVRWVAKEQGPSFCHTLNESESQAALRAKVHFVGALTSLRLTALQLWFSNQLARPASSADEGLADLTRIKAAYDELCGSPPAKTFAAFCAHARAVQAIKCWDDWFRCVRLTIDRPHSARHVLVSMLQRAVVDSEQAGYHRAAGTRRRQHDDRDALFPGLPAVKPY